MKFKIAHQNFNVYDLNKSLDFYTKALNLKEKKRKEAKDGSFILSYLGNEENDFLLELTWLKGMDRPYNLGDNEIHLAFVTDEYEQAYELHKEMNCICYENKEMGIYFISDPDGYWLEIIPNR